MITRFLDEVIVRFAEFIARLLFPHMRNRTPEDDDNLAEFITNFFGVPDVET